MQRIRFNIASLLVIILIIGVGFAALRESNDLWESGVFTVTLCALLISILLAVHRTESWRAFWIGFALFGWVYLGFSLVPSIESRLITTRALAYLDSKVPGRSTVVAMIGTVSGTGNNQVSNGSFILDGIQVAAVGEVTVGLRDTATGKLLTATGKLLGGWSGTTENFIRIGHSLFALLVGWLGGQLSRRLHLTSRSPELNTAVAVEGTPP